jgi:hypothetical protein
MKILFVSVATSLVIIASTFSAPPTSESSVPGRYQVVMGSLEYGVPTPEGNEKNWVIHTAIMIDTATGKTWFLQPVDRPVHEKKQDGSPIFVPDREWSEIKLKG